MYCVNCGNKLEDGDKFCTNCGAAVESTNNNIGLNIGNGGDKLLLQIKELKCVNEYLDVASVNNMRTIKFGHYPLSSSDDKKMPIEWLVLEKDFSNGKALIISKYSLFDDLYDPDYRDFTGYEYVNWEECPLRKKLNEIFINKAFTEDEKKKILESNIINNGYDEYTTRDGKDTSDKIFLLSFNETKKYFKSDTQRICYKINVINEGCDWWVRTTFDGISRGIKKDGSLSRGEFTPYFSYGVRPAMWIKI